MIWKEGQTIYQGKYTIKSTSPLGRGGFSIIFFACNQKGEPVVIKIPNEQVQNDLIYKKLLDNFHKEGDLMKVCDHPHIVKFFESFYEDSLPCICMEYIAGKTLKDWVDESGPLPEIIAIKYIQQIADAIQHIHNSKPKPILHRDIKPSNIIKRDKLDKIVVIDFGIAREFIPGYERTLTIGHSDGFASPEQYKPKAKWDNYTDVYGLSATLYFLLTGKVPDSACFRLATDELKPLDQMISVSPQVSEAVKKGMNLDCQERPQSVSEWLKILMDDSISVQQVSNPISSVHKSSISNLIIPRFVTVNKAADLVNNLEQCQNPGEKIGQFFKLAETNPDVAFRVCFTLLNNDADITIRALAIRTFGKIKHQATKKDMASCQSELSQELLKSLSNTIQDRNNDDLIRWAAADAIDNIGFPKAYLRSVNYGGLQHEIEILAQAIIERKLEEINRIQRLNNKNERTARYKLHRQFWVYGPVVDLFKENSSTENYHNLVTDVIEELQVLGIILALDIPQRDRPNYIAQKVALSLASKIYNDLSADDQKNLAFYLGSFLLDDSRNQGLKIIATKLIGDPKNIPKPNLLNTLSKILFTKL